MFKNLYTYVIIEPFKKIFLIVLNILITFFLLFPDITNKTLFVGISTFYFF